MGWRYGHGAILVHEPEGAISGLPNLGAGARMVPTPAGENARSGERD